MNEADQRADKRDDIPPWGAGTVPVALALGLALGFASTIVVEIGGTLTGGSVKNPSAGVSLLAALAFDLSFVGVALFLARAVGGRLQDFGYRLLPLRALVISVIVAGAVYFAVSDLYAWLLNLKGEKLPKELGFGSGTADLIGAGVFVCVVAPVLEELFFRGYLFGALRQLPLGARAVAFGPWVAAVIVGLLFGLAHAGSAPARYLVPLALFGFVLCLVRWRTRSLYPCMALHSINNALALGVNELHWSAPGVIGLIAAALATIAAVTVPLASMVNWRL